MEAEEVEENRKGSLYQKDVVLTCDVKKRGNGTGRVGNGDSSKNILFAMCRASPLQPAVHNVHSVTGASLPDTPTLCPSQGNCVRGEPLLQNTPTIQGIVLIVAL